MGVSAGGATRRPFLLRMNPIPCLIIAADLAFAHNSARIYNHTGLFVKPILDIFVSGMGNARRTRLLLWPINEIRVICVIRLIREI
jgi:hypothetical protein